MKQSQSNCALTIVIGFCALHAAADPPYFSGLGQVGSYACDISGDGTTVVGYVRPGLYFAPTAFRWTASEGLVGLGDLSDGSWDTWATSASSDGSTIVGAAVGQVCTDWCHSEAFRWTADEAIFPDLLETSARGVSADGSVVVGAWWNGYYPVFDSFRWTIDGDVVLLGYLPGGGSMFGTAGGVSADGSIVVGSSSSAFGVQAYTWSADDGMVGLGFFAGGTQSDANAVSGDGSVVVGSCVSATGTEAFRWTAAAGMTGLGDLSGGAFESVALDASFNGSVIVGRASSGAGYEAFVWDLANGMRSLRSVLVDDLGLDLTGWTLISATGVSDDGTTVVGTGVNSGHDEAWIAHFGHACGLAGDLNQDGAVNLVDLVTLLTNFGRIGDARPYHGDTDGDGNVDLSDLTILLSSFGAVCM